MKRFIRSGSTFQGSSFSTGSPSVLGLSSSYMKGVDPSKSSVIGVRVRLSDIGMSAVFVPPFGLVVAVMMQISLM